MLLVCVLRNVTLNSIWILLVWLKTYCSTLSILVIKNWRIGVFVVAEHDDVARVNIDPLLMWMKPILIYTLIKSMLSVFIPLQAGFDFWPGPVFSNRNQQLPCSFRESCKFPNTFNSHRRLVAVGIVVAKIRPILFSMLPGGEHASESNAYRAFEWGSWSRGL